MSTLQILFEDVDLLVINKAAGRLTEGDSTSLEYEVQQLRDERARALHRLDQGTSGVLAFSLRRQHHAKFVLLWEKRRIRKTYWAWVQGSWPTKFKELGGKDREGRPMQTHVSVLRQVEGASLLELHPVTGRRHQLRIQCAEAGCPILGDLRYGSRADSTFAPEFALHARALSFAHPLTGEQMEFVAEAPEAWTLFEDSFQKT